MEETRDLESGNPSFSSRSVFIIFMTLGGYLDSNSLSLLICKMGIIITVLLNLPHRVEILIYVKVS